MSKSGRRFRQAMTVMMCVIVAVIVHTAVNRDPFAFGGEWMLLALPVIVLGVRQMVRDIKK